MLAVVTEHFLGRQIFRIKRTLPFFVGIAAGSNVKLHH
jgi:hypothetical protein